MPHPLHCQRQWLSPGSDSLKAAPKLPCCQLAPHMRWPTPPCPMQHPLPRLHRQSRVQALPASVLFTFAPAKPSIPAPAHKKSKHPASTTLAPHKIVHVPEPHSSNTHSLHYTNVTSTGTGSSTTPPPGRLPYGGTTAQILPTNAHSPPAARQHPYRTPQRAQRGLPTTDRTCILSVADYTAIRVPATGKFLVNMTPNQYSTTVR